MTIPIKDALPSLQAAILTAHVDAARATSGLAAAAADACGERPDWALLHRGLDRICADLETACIWARVAQNLIVLGGALKEDPQS